MPTNSSAIFCNTNPFEKNNQSLMESGKPSSKSSTKTKTKESTTKTTKGKSTKPKPISENLETSDTRMSAGGNYVNKPVSISSEDMLDEDKLEDVLKSSGSEFDPNSNLDPRNIVGLNIIKGYTTHHDYPHFETDIPEDAHVDDDGNIIPGPKPDEEWPHLDISSEDPSDLDEGKSYVSDTTIGASKKPSPSHQESNKLNENVYADPSVGDQKDLNIPRSSTGITYEIPDDITISDFVEGLNTIIAEYIARNAYVTSFKISDGIISATTHSVETPMVIYDSRPLENLIAPSEDQLPDDVVDSLFDNNTGEAYSKNKTHHQKETVKETKQDKKPVRNKNPTKKPLIPENKEQKNQKYHMVLPGKAGRKPIKIEIDSSEVEPFESIENPYLIIKKALKKRNIYTQYGMTHDIKQGTIIKSQ
jgi:hypothetical protein